MNGTPVNHDPIVEQKKQNKKQINHGCQSQNFKVFQDLLIELIGTGKRQQKVTSEHPICNVARWRFIKKIDLVRLLNDFQLFGNSQVNTN